MPDTTTTLADLLDREAVIERITALFLATDRRDWTAVERCFTPEVRFDMSSAGGGPEATLGAGDIAAGWHAGLAPMEHVHHQAGNFVVRVAGDRAEAFCYGIAYHHRARADGRSVRVFVGSYDFSLERGDDAEGASPWRIAAMRFTLKFIDGNPALEAAE